MVTEEATWFSLPQELTLKTERRDVNLIKFRKQDATLLFALLKANIIHFDQWQDKITPKYKTLQDVLDKIENPPLKLRMGIWQGDKLAGQVNLEPHGQSFEVGYMVGFEFAHQQLATIATKPIVAYALDNYPGRRIYAEVERGNRGSVISLERAGFVLSGRREIYDIFDFRKN